MPTEGELQLRGQIRDAVADFPVRVRFHGAPRNAPSLPIRPYGYIAFRSWGSIYVEIAPSELLSSGDFMGLLDAIRPFDIGRGTTFMGGEFGGPFFED